MTYPTDTMSRVAPAESRRHLGVLPDPCWLLNLDQIEKDTGYLSTPEFISPSDSSQSTYAFTTDHVLYSKLRPNLNKVVCPDFPGICTTELIRLRPDPKRLNRKFLTYYLRSESFMGFARHVVAGAKMPRMVMDRFWEHLVPLPPLPEQHRIVEILDQADALRQQRRQADEIARKILPALFQEMFGDRPWPKLPVSTILRDIQGGWSPVCESRAPEPDEWGVLKLGSATYCEYRASEAKALPPDQSPRPDLEVKAGDLLFTRKNTQDLVGASAYVFETPRKRTIPDLIFRLIPDPSLVDPIYLWQALIEPTTRDAIRSLASGAAASMVNISRGRLLPLELPVPPLDLQKKFAAAVLSLRAPQQAQTASATNLETLFQALLHRAFDGSLTAKWREDHPKELLQEIHLQTPH